MSTEAVTTEIGESVVSKPMKMDHRGICSTCNNAPTCTYQKDSDPPVLQCDEFDDYVSPSVTISRQRVSHSDSSHATLTSEDEDASDYRGLCVNCDNRRTCAYPKPEGGIWHCAEYQ